MDEVRPRRTDRVIDAVLLTGYVSDPERVAARLERQSKTTYPDSGAFPKIAGYVGNLRASVKGDRIRISGSLPTYMGQTRPLFLPEIAQARARLENTLKADLGALDVWTLEITADLVLPRPVGVYLPLLLHSPRRQRIEYRGSSVAFAVPGRRMTFYCRAARCRSLGIPPPSGHVLRAELKYRKRLARQLGIDVPLSFADLHSLDWMERLVDNWRHEYDRIEKARAHVPFDVLADVHRSLSLVGLGVVGMDSLEAALRAESDAGRINRSTMYDRRRWLRDLAADPVLTAEDERIADLDAAVHGAARRALAGP